MVLVSKIVLFVLAIASTSSYLRYPKRGLLTEIVRPHVLNFILNNVQNVLRTLEV